MVTLNGSVPDLLGLSTDTKPDDAFENSLFLELDTGDFYYFTDGEWAKVGEAVSSAKSALNNSLNNSLKNDLRSEEKEQEKKLEEEETSLPFEDEEGFKEVVEDGEARK